MEDHLYSFGTLLEFDLGISTDFLDLLETFLHSDEDVAALARVCGTSHHWCVRRRVWYRRFEKRFGFVLDPVIVVGNPLWYNCVMNELRQVTYPKIYNLWFGRIVALRTSWTIGSDIVLSMDFLSVPNQDVMLRHLVIYTTLLDPRATASALKHRDTINHMALHFFKTLPIVFFNESSDNGLRLISRNVLCAITEYAPLPAHAMHLLFNLPDVHVVMDVPLFASIRGCLIRLLYVALKSGFTVALRTHETTS